MGGFSCRVQWGVGWVIDIRSMLIWFLWEIYHFASQCISLCDINANQEPQMHQFLEMEINWQMMANGTTDQLHWLLYQRYIDPDAPQSKTEVTHLLSYIQSAAKHLTPHLMMGLKHQRILSPSQPCTQSINLTGWIHDTDDEPLKISTNKGWRYVPKDTKSRVTSLTCHLCHGTSPAASSNLPCVRYWILYCLQASNIAISLYLKLHKLLSYITVLWYGQSHVLICQRFLQTWE